MKFQATNLTISKEPEMFKTLTKVELTRPRYKKVDGKWETTGEDVFSMVAFGDVGAALMMEGEGVVIDVEGAIKQRDYEAKNGKVYKNLDLIINEYTHATDD